MEPLDLVDAPFQRRPAGCLVPLTAFQLREWNGNLDRGRRLSYWRTCAVSVRILGPLDLGLLRNCIEAVAQRHESLRTRIVTVDDIPTQHIDAAVAPFSTIDLTDHTPAGMTEEAARLAQELIDTEVGFSVGPLFEAKLLKLSEREHLLIVAVDHMVSDNMSSEIIRREIWSLYDHAARGQTFSLPPLSVQFADYAVWQDQNYKVWQQRHEGYWRAKLSGAQRARLPVGDVLQANHRARAMLAVPFGETLSTRLRELAWRERALLPLVIFTVYAAAMSRWCNQRDMVLAFASHGRQGRAQLANVVGRLTTRLWLRAELHAQDSFLYQLKRFGEELSSAYQHQDFDRVPDFCSECTPEFTFNWVTRSTPAPVLREVSDGKEQVRILPFPVRPFSNKVNETFKFLAMFSDTEDGIVMNLWYRSDLFAPSEMERFGRSIELLAKEFVARPLSSPATKAISL